MAATMGFEDLASLTHQMENVLDLVRNEKLVMQDFIFDTLFKGLDALEAMVEDITQGGEGKADVSAIVADLQAIVRGEAPSAGSAKSAGSAPAKQETNTAIQLDEFQYSVLQQSIGEGHRVLYIDVAIRDDCQLKAVRAYMVFDLLEKSGEVIKSHPTVQDIEQEKFEKSFSLYYITQKDPAELKQQILNVSEIDQASVVELDHESLQQMAEMGAASAQSAAAVAEETKPDTAAPVAAAPAAESKENKPAAAAKPAAKTLLIDRVRLKQLASEVQNHALTETVEHMSRVSSDLQNIVLKLRMVPVDTVFSRFPRMVRDLAKSLDKKLELVITGAETELDRTVIDEIGDPLVHLLRNAVDHGIESPQDRVAAGKPETGTVHLRAFHSGNHVFIEIEEDGRGIYRDNVLKSALKKGIVTEEEAKGMSDEQVHQLLFAPGFSTAEKISD
ncbi:hypothetical protein BGX30_007571, partial [Mortierella sp. GBA39]